MNESKVTWEVHYAIYGGFAGKDFDQEKRAYEYAKIHRPASIIMSCPDYPGRTVARFYELPEWYKE